MENNSLKNALSVFPYATEVFVKNIVSRRSGAFNPHLNFLSFCSVVLFCS